MKVLVTGVAGFIGYHLAQRLLEEGMEVIGIDNLNDYYDVSLKKARLERLVPQSGFKFEFLELSDRTSVTQLFQNHSFDSSSILRPKQVYATHSKTLGLM
jgi:UDP-glucuronate 4-epimerase